MQFDSRSQFPRSKPQCVSFRFSPRAPFNDHGKPKSEKFLAELPLQGLNSFPARLIPQIYSKSAHPFVGTKSNCAEFGLKLPGVCRLA